MKTNARITDSNNRDAGRQPITITVEANIIVSSLIVGGREYFATGKSGESCGAVASSAPAGTIMFEMEGAGAYRAWVDLAGRYVHLD